MMLYDTFTSPGLAHMGVAIVIYKLCEYSITTYLALLRTIRAAAGVAVVEVHGSMRRQRPTTGSLSYNCGSHRTIPLYIPAPYTPSDANSFRGMRMQIFPAVTTSKRSNLVIVI